MEEQIYVQAGGLRLEALYESGGNAGAGAERGAVLSHPHPQMGGCMMNGVVEHMVPVFVRQGFSTLRFNFRGVGSSEGVYDEGKGEQDDVRGAVSFLREKGKNAIILAGYSFGAWINAQVLAADAGFLPGVLVSPPMALLEFDLARLTGKVGLIIAGEHDDFCPSERVRFMAERIGSSLKVIGGADHFFFGHEGKVARALDEFLASPALQRRS